MIRQVVRNLHLVASADMHQMEEGRHHTVVQDSWNYVVLARRRVDIVYYVVLVLLRADLPTLVAVCIFGLGTFLD
jgi:hypothetical protein